MQRRALNQIALLVARSLELLSAVSQEHCYSSGYGLRYGGADPTMRTGMALWRRRRDHMMEGGGAGGTRAREVGQ
jgi:hypothetical protein